MRRGRTHVTDASARREPRSPLRHSGVENRTIELFAPDIRITCRMGDRQ
jgi:hypothetical protein